jgi:hypothetical protein
MRKDTAAMSYPHQKFYEAMVCLVSEGPLRKRLTAAAMYLVQLMPKDFAGSDRKHVKAWQQIVEDLTWADPDRGDEGKLHATIRRMIDEDASRVAREILDLFLALSGGLRW